MAARADVLPSGDLCVTLDDGSVHHFDVACAALSVQPRSQLGRALGAAVDSQGNLVIDAHCGTTVPGLYAAGDVAIGLDQLCVAAGQGAVVATAIHNQLRPRPC